MTTDNNFLLIILIITILFWINCINTKTNKNNLERFGKTESPLLSTKIVNKVSNNMNLNNNTQDLLVKPPNNQDPSKLATSYQSMANQYITNDKQVMYSNITSTENKQTSQLSNVDNSYMLLPSNNMPDEKFNKVLAKDPARTVLTSGDLLPKDENKDWFQVPNSKFNLMQAVDLEVPEIKIGIDTVGQSRKNATYDLRAAPPNPKFVVSPWSNSTIEPDYNTKPLC